MLDSKKAYSNRFHTNGGNEAYSVMAHTLRDIYGTDVLDRNRKQLYRKCTEGRIY